MTAKKATASRKRSPKPDEVEPEAPEVSQPATEMEGEAYSRGFHGEVGDTGDYSMAAEVARLSES